MVVTGRYGAHSSTEEVLAQVNRDKTFSYIRAWEDKERASANNRFEKASARIESWENGQKAAIESRARQSIEDLERRRAAILERMRNDHAEVHRLAQQKLAEAQARKREDYVRIEEQASVYRTQGQKPVKNLLCFEFCS